jgi:hypothetical protein
MLSPLLFFIFIDNITKAANVMDKIEIINRWIEYTKDLYDKHRFDIEDFHCNKEGPPIQRSKKQSESLTGGKHRVQITSQKKR